MLLVAITSLISGRLHIIFTSSLWAPWRHAKISSLACSVLSKYFLMNQKEIKWPTYRASGCEMTTAKTTMGSNQTTDKCGTYVSLVYAPAALCKQI